MATPSQIEQQKQQQKLLTSKLVGSTAGTAAQLATEASLRIAEGSAQSSVRQAAAGYRTGSALATIIDLVSGIGIAAYSFITQRKEAKKQEKKTKKQVANQSYIDEVLSKIEATGDALIESGYNPLTAQFEDALYKNLIDDVGYRGYCNASVWVPGTKPGPGRLVMFKASNDGRTVTPINMDEPPYDFQTYWYSRCRGFKDKWILDYQDILIRQGRVAELEELQSSVSKGTWIVRGTIGIFLLMAGIFWIMNMRRIK
ncbi:hypothetical protein C4588_03010 [Candidatus Parcubacteria bacterium]|nr:MAG: hypothetical protein C4588_03010 [Candidatus Parcubacteria bacterium]